MVLALTILKDAIVFCNIHFRAVAEDIMLRFVKVKSTGRSFMDYRNPDSVSGHPPQAQSPVV